jgi:hypothetical protein
MEALNDYDGIEKLDYLIERTIASYLFEEAQDSEYIQKEAT